nr:MAG TPA: hypothetical protein [Crassvirales sp.]
MVGIRVCLTKKNPLTYFFNSYIALSLILISKLCIIFVSLSDTNLITPLTFSF